MEIRTVEYIDAKGLNHFRDWSDKLDVQAAVEVLTALSRLRLGNTSNIKWFAGIGELRINHGPGYRIYLAREGSDLVVLFGGGTKQRQQHDISRAKRLHEEYKLRKRNE